MKRDSLEDFQCAVNKLPEHAEAMRSGCISAYCWVEWHMGLSAVRRSETAFINVPLERVHLMSQEWRNYECIIRETRGRETVARGILYGLILEGASAPRDQEQEKRSVLETASPPWLHALICCLLLFAHTHLKAFLFNMAATCFLCAAGHFLGNHSVLDILRQEGYDVEHTLAQEPITQWVHTLMHTPHQSFAKFWIEQLAPWVWVFWPHHTGNWIRTPNVLL